MELLFTPSLSEEEFFGLFPGIYPLELRSNLIMQKVDALTSTAYPKLNPFKDKIWHDFYLPLQREREAIAVPVGIVKGTNCFIVSLKNGKSLRIEGGEGDVRTAYFTFFDELSRFVPLLQRDPSLPRKLVPYDIQTGTIPGKYVLEKILSPEEKKELQTKYYFHLKKKLSVKTISLEEYLSTAAICYQAAFPEKTSGLNNLEQYQRWADCRHGGMLNLENFSDPEEFMSWRNSDAYAGSHPFEIVYSPSGYGVHLIPPYSWFDDKDYYFLSLGNLNLAPEYLKMVRALIDNEVPFRSNHLKSTLDYLAGESSFLVNKGNGERSFNYFDTPEYQDKYFPHITWDALKIPRWKK